MPGAGAAIQFVILLVLVTIFGAAVVLQTAYIFVSIAQQTADGRDEVDWPKEAWSDRVGKALHLLWLVACWLVPLGFLLRVIGPQSLAASASLYVGVPAGLFCLLFPVTLLSSFSAASPWVLLRWEALQRMARSPAATVGFYFLSAPLCLLGGAALYATLAHHLFYAMPVLATVVFLYARLIGRYTRLLDRVRLKESRPKADQKERPKKKKKKPKAPVHDPWAVPEEESADKERGKKVETYGIAQGEAAPERREAKATRPRVKGYAVSPEEPPPRPKEVPLDGSPPVEEKRIPSGHETPLPGRPLIDGVFTFPWYSSNLGMWGLLTLLFLAWGFLYVVMQEVRPF